MVDWMDRPWFVTGASAGFGRAIVEAVLDQQRLAEVREQLPDAGRADYPGSTGKLK
jgi:NAD(P)-dependent dehydrogenase (short-subunit alcohol dehydrogenase family)